ncbi:hypothetical protein M758_4G121800 [Ceratodon purpureus]|nr:hypothetical protein M758_4G121800 [Ceratodon purpureus]
MKSLTQASWIYMFLTMTLTWLSHKASAQKGFLSLDCGAPAPYFESMKGISWIPDDAYISGGMTASVTKSSVGDPKWNSHLLNLRYFPDTARTRYCYTVPTTMGKNYLLRAIFFHGGYNGNSLEVKFDIAVDLFDTRMVMTISDTGSYYSQEFIFRAFKENIQFCLFRTSTDNPFISSLELRTLADDMYPAVAGGSALYNQYRADFGPYDGASLSARYPDDPYDRFWFTPSTSTVAGGISAKPSGVQYTGYAIDKAPPKVMSTAIKMATGKADLTWHLFPDFPTNPFVLNVFFAELEASSAQTRTFDIFVNRVLWVPNVNIYSYAQNALYMPIEFSTNKSKVDAQGFIDVTLSPTAYSGSPPIGNAAEFYSVHKKMAATLDSNVLAIEGLKTAFKLEKLWTGDPCLIIPYDWLTCSSGSPPEITTVNLSSAGLTGYIPDLSALTSLTILRLDNNELTGEVPLWLLMLPNLKELYLQNNRLEGDVPLALLLLPVIRLEGNPDLCIDTKCPKKKNNTLIIAGVLVGALVGIGMVIALVVVLYCHCKQRKGANSTPPFPAEVKEEGPSARGTGLINEGLGSRFTLAQVMAATKNNAKMLGRGGFGPVYYGRLATGQEVAVKVSAKGSEQGYEEFINEIELLTRVHHKNLVSLVGYCDEGENLMLLYEFMPKGTVQEHLYGLGAKSRSSFLDWKTRLQIALNSAQGLEYLHVGCNPVIFHRDVKSNNILLNNKLLAKVADFGLSKSTDLKDNVTHMSTMVKGTIGYLDPEYYMSQKLTDKSDVYSFGVVLLELICARPPFVQQLPKDQQLLDRWVRPHVQNGTLEEIVDPALAGQYNRDAMWKVADLAMQSVKPEGKDRPTMSTIVHELRSALSLEDCLSTTTTRPPSQGSSSGFRFDMIQSSSFTSDPQFGSNTTVQAR